MSEKFVLCSAVIELIQTDVSLYPFHQEPPVYLRAHRYKYWFTKPKADGSVVCLCSKLYTLNLVMLGSEGTCLPWQNVNQLMTRLCQASNSLFITKITLTHEDANSSLVSVGSSYPQRWWRRVYDEEFYPTVQLGSVVLESMLNHHGLKVNFVPMYCWILTVFSGKCTPFYSPIMITINLVYRTNHRCVVHPTPLLLTPSGGCAPSSGEFPPTHWSGPSSPAASPFACSRSYSTRVNTQVWAVVQKM